MDITKDATNEEIKSAFRKKALVYHPDKLAANANANANTENTTDEFTLIKQAYDTLSDANKRAQYDESKQTNKDTKSTFLNVMNPQWKKFMSDAMIKMFAMSALKTEVVLTIDVPFCEVYQGKSKRIDIKTRQWLNGTYQYVQDSLVFSLVNIQKKYVFKGQGDASIFQGFQGFQDNNNMHHMPHMQVRGDVIVHVNIIEYATGVRIDTIFSEHDLFINKKITLHDFYMLETLECDICEGVSIPCPNKRKQSYVMRNLGLPMHCNDLVRSDVYINIELDIPYKLRTKGRDKLIRVLQKYFN